MRWLIDGMNVIGSRPDAWWRDREAAMAALVARLERWAAAGGEDVTVVFEREPSLPVAADRIRVAFAAAPGPDAGDDEIVRLLGEGGGGAETTVVTSDRRLAARARATGASVEPSGAFRRLIESA